MIPPEEILAGLNTAQREAATATRGPVAILAGAGTGKTTTVTRRIACQVATGVFPAGAILAVTFTEKAAGQLKARLAALGVEGVEARTFHSAALAQLSRMWRQATRTPLPDVLDTKARLISSLASSLPMPHKFIPRGDLANEIEWAKNRMVPPEGYLQEVERTGHPTPIPPPLMERVFAGYERRKRATKQLDFEDMLALAVRMFDEHPRTIEQVRSRLQAFTVDEYQDVNPLQAALLDRWVGERDEVCVVGDDYQTIYSFTGASPEHLLRFTDRFPGARVVRLEDSYRSTPEILATANRLAETMGGFRKMLKAMRPGGPSPVLQPLPDEAAEVSFVVEEIRRLRDGEGVALEEIAVLYRINARSEPYEEALSAAGIPYQVRDGAFLRRPGPRAVMQGLRRENGSPSDAVDRVTDALGFDPETEPDAAEEVTRQADLSRLRTLAAEFASSQPGAEVGAFVEEVTRRFSATETARGVNLMTFHRAKGLEFDAVFLPRLVDGELPFRSGRTKANEDEERRLLYVGITRARTHLFMTWPLGAKWARSPFLAELGAPSHREAAGVRARELQAARTAQRRGKPPAVASPLYDRLRQWRKARAQADGVPAYVVFPDTTLTALVAARPLSRKELLAVSGVGPAKMDLYGGELLELISDAINDGL